jgi:hypothetical protein
MSFHYPPGCELIHLCTSLQIHGVFTNANMGPRERYGVELPQMGHVDVDRVSVKIGEDFHLWSFGGGT